MNGAIEVKDENGVVVRRHSPFPPKKLAAFARKKKMGVKEALIFALEETPNYTEAAKMIGISRPTMQRWVKAWGITVER